MKEIFTQAFIVNVRRLIRSVIKIPQEIRIAMEDIEQETFRRFYEKVNQPDFELSGLPENFALGIARNVYFEEVRAYTQTDYLDGDLEIDEEDSNEFIKKLKQQEISSRIFIRCLEQLKPRSKEIYDLRMQEYSFKEIADKMGLANEKVAFSFYEKTRRSINALAMCDLEYKMKNEERIGER